MFRIDLPNAFVGLLWLVGLFLAVVGMVNLWVRYKTWRDDRLVAQQIYNKKRLIWLYVKCWMISLAVSTLLYCVEMDPLMMLLVVLLGGLSLIGVVYGEDLAEARLLQSQSENLMLRSQLNPHFLYNTLNNIDALIWLDQEKASVAVTNLCELMRYFTYSARQECVELGEEINHLNRLVELQRLRMPVDMALVFLSDIDHPKTSIAPLLLLPLIENSFKHCGNLNEPRAIVIQITEHNGLLDYRSDNNIAVKEDMNQRKRHGVGLSVLRQRLSLLYQDDYLLESIEEEGRYKVHLQVRL